jgi:hypothetical protein
VFYSYSHRDARMRDQLETHLAMLRRDGLIVGWHDRRIVAGSEWEDSISENLEHAQVILLLISANFIASEYCYGKEMQRAMQRHEAGQAKVIPIILRDVDWKTAPFAKIQALPTDARPITSWRNRDAAWADVARGIRSAVIEMGHKPALVEQGSDSDDELGLLDYMVELEESMQRLMSTLRDLASVGTEYQARVEGWIASHPPALAVSASQKRAWLADLSRILMEYAQTTEKSVPLLLQGWEAFDASSQGALYLVSRMGGSVGATESASIIGSLLRFRDGVQVPMKQLRDLQLQMKQFTGLSKDLNLAVQRLDRAWERVIVVFTKGGQSAEDLSRILLEVSDNEPQ